jgi:hypothetical protein
MVAQASDGRDESELERWDRNFIELLQELRVMQTGPQILLAFLLTVPFTSRFPNGDAVEKSVYAVTLLAAAAAAVLLITPAAYHRRIFRQGRKPELVRIGTVMAGLGLACLALAIAGTVFVALDVVFARTVGAVAGAAVALLAAALWYALPTVNRIRLHGRVVPAGDHAQDAAGDQAQGAAGDHAQDAAGESGPTSGERHGITAEPRDRPEKR